MRRNPLSKRRCKGRALAKALKFPTRVDLDRANRRRLKQAIAAGRGRSFIEGVE